jgi:hypothetical protein
MCKVGLILVLFQELKPRPWAADYQPPAPPDENSNVKKTPEEIEREIKVRVKFLNALLFLLQSGSTPPVLKVPKCEIFHLFDFNDFYGIKSV